MRVRLVGVVALSVVFLAAPIARASRLVVKSNASGGGTLVNSGSGDVGTNEDSSDGNTSAWSELGFASATDFLLIGHIETGPLTFDSADLLFLKVVATVPLPFNCLDPACAPFLPLRTLESANLALSNLEADATNVAWTGLLTPTPITMNEGTTYLFSLPNDSNTADLDTLIALAGAGNVRIGLSALVDWGSDPNFILGPGQSIFVTPNDAVPEPASLILLGSGIVGLAGAARARRKRHNGPAAPDRMKLPQ